MPRDVNAKPSKAFFVSMLTRDISLEDAILDLLDNCIDGLLRDLRDRERGESPYDGYEARITATPDEFTIKDNCGGIPKEIAKNSAFRLGRPDSERDNDLPTVGMYGIGMKRALFKMGRHSKVTSKHRDDSYYVEIPETWLLDDGEWDLEMTEAENLLEREGTLIQVTSLYENIATKFGEANTFLSDLGKDISSLFTVIIQKGFTIYLNNKKIEPASLSILSPKDFAAVPQGSILPYAYSGSTDRVSINLIVGFYRELASDQEIDDQNLTPRTTDNAGWTVICNDRVVLAHDKTPLTGWGTRDIPSYHTQFIAIAGVVTFSSNDSYALPLNTTKRGLDTSSSVYLQARKYMMEGLKLFTDFTNRWKGRITEAAPAFEALAPSDPLTVLARISEEQWKHVRGGADDEKRLSPDLPRPPQADVRRRIAYYRPIDEIRELGEYLFGDVQADPSQIGSRCFDDILEQARKQE